MPLSKTYEYESIEERWYNFWLEKGYFKANPQNVLSGKKKPFVVMIPPPNVTGRIHMGHVLNNTIQDIAVRFKRMLGYEVLWQPGTDHAGIATQNVVERAIAKEGLTRFDLGREKFLERVWKWKEEYGNIIINQLKKLGISADWSRLKFTMDEDYYRAVIKAFVELYRAGLIYRGLYLVNWCPRCGTTLADDEVEYKEVKGKLYYIKYPLENGDGYVAVATTRPETYLGDTAVAVHPEDPRYKHLIGRKVKLPLVDWIRKASMPDGTEVEVPPEIPIIADKRVDREFGTGAVKVTPAHDPTDFEIGNEHNLPRVIIMDAQARMNDNAGIFKGLDRYEARNKVVAELERNGYILKVEDHEHSVGHCYRCGTVIEPYLSEQWFMNLRHFAQQAIEVVKNGKIKLIPERSKKIYFNWLENVRDWAISRQIWWGHRIPVYYGPDGKYFVAESYEEAKKLARAHYGKEVELKQDEDVLDTWFSSALWPFATLGWPEDTPELKAFFPTSLLVTGWDILFFWVARMIVMSLFFMKKEPFKVVYLHGLIRDEYRRKMSKSLGNSPEPLELFKKYSVDGVRMGLMLIAPEGQDVIFSMKRMEVGRNYANKLWNIGRFLLMNYEKHGYVQDAEPKELEDRWILTEFNELVENITNALENHEYNDAARMLYSFTWGKFADWYLEAIKGREDIQNAVSLGINIFRELLKLHHPFMPFITEELYQHLPNKDEVSITISPWPKVSDYTFKDAKEEFSIIMEVVKAIREVRGIFNIPFKTKLTVKLLVDGTSKEVLNLVLENTRLLETLANVDVEKSESFEPRSAGIVMPNLKAYVPLKDVKDISKEVEKLRKEMKQLEKHISNLESKLKNQNFLTKAPVDVVEGTKRKLEEFRRKYEGIERFLKNLDGFHD